MSALAASDDRLPAGAIAANEFEIAADAPSSQPRWTATSPRRPRSLDVANKRAMVTGKGGNAEPIGWETATARLLLRYLPGRSDGPLFRSSLAPVPSRQPAAADAEPRTGPARLSYRRAD